MSSLHEAQLRHAKHYLEVLDDANILYLEGGELMLAGLRMAAMEWPNIVVAQVRMAQQGLDDDDMLELCLAYLETGPEILALRQHPNEKIRWSDSALKAAQRLGKREAEAFCLSMLAGAYHALGKSRRAIDLFKQKRC